MAENLLGTLRECIRQDRIIKEIRGKISLGGKCYVKTVRAFPVKWLQGNKKMNQKDKYYNLKEVVFLVKNKDLSYPDYMKKAQEKGIRPLMSIDRRAFLDYLCGPKLKTRSTCDKTYNQKKTDKGGPKNTSHKEDQIREQQEEKDKCSSTKDHQQKPHLRTYSRKRSTHEFQPPSTRQSFSNEDLSSDMDETSANNELSDELAFIRNENDILEKSLKSLTSFLMDHLGVSDKQLEAIQEAESNTIDLSDIASQIKSAIAHAGGMSEKIDSDAGTSKFCYRAVRHPIRGWEILKQELSSVLADHGVSQEVWEVEEHHSASIEECLDKGALLLKQAFSVLISQMKEMTFEDAETLGKKAVEDCLADAVDCFRDLFSEMMSSNGINDDEFGIIENYVDRSRAEIGKLFHSLAKTLKSVKNMPRTQKDPLSLFHLPLPTFSLAMNPSKFTYSVILEMYVRIGLAELRSILMNMQEFTSVPFSTNFPPMSSHGEINQENAAKENEPVENMVDANIPSSSEARPKPSSGSHPLEGLLCHSNGAPTIVKNIASYQTRCRSLSDDDFCQYTVFKTSLGNTLVSSFKKKIQEKIQAGNSTDCED